MSIKSYGNKRGSIVDPLLTSGYFLVLAITILTVLFIWVQFQDQMAVTITGSTIETELNKVMSELRTSYFYMDYLVPILVGGLMLLSFILAFQAGASGIYAFWSLIVWALGILLASVYTNVYISYIATYPAIGVEVPVLNFIMLNLKYIVLFWLFVITAVMFRKKNSEVRYDDSTLRREGFA